MGKVDQANLPSHPCGIQSSAKTASQPGITHTNVHLRSCSTEGLLTKDMAKATPWLLQFGLQKSGFTEWRESCQSRRAFPLKSFVSTYFPSATLHFFLCTFQGHDRRLCRLCYINNDRTAFNSGKWRTGCHAPFGVE